MSVTLELSDEALAKLAEALAKTGLLDQKHWLTVKEYAEHMGVTTQAVYQLIERGDVPGVKRVGRAIRIPASLIAS